MKPGDQVKLKPSVTLEDLRDFHIKDDLPTGVGQVVHANRNLGVVDVDFPGRKLWWYKREWLELVRPSMSFGDVVWVRAVVLEAGGDRATVAFLSDPMRPFSIGLSEITREPAAKVSRE